MFQSQTSILFVFIENEYVESVSILRSYFGSFRLIVRAASLSGKTDPTDLSNVNISCFEKTSIHTFLHIYLSIYQAGRQISHVPPLTQLRWILAGRSDYDPVGGRSHRQADVRQLHAIDVTEGVVQEGTALAGIPQHRVANTPVR